MKNRRSRIRSSALKIKKVMLEKDAMLDGKFHSAGTKLVVGARCPACGMFFPGALKVSFCGCGYQSKELKPHEEKRKMKKAKRMEYEKKQTEASVSA